MPLQQVGDVIIGGELAIKCKIFEGRQGYSNLDELLHIFRHMVENASSNNNHLHGMKVEQSPA